MSPAPTSLAALARVVPGASIVGDPATTVTGLYQDSRKLTAGAAFAVRRGATSDARAFLPAALARGARAIITDTRWDDPPVPALVVPDVQAAIGPLARAVYGDPFRELVVVGVTGTNGKTTTVHLLRQLLDALGHRAASLGTLGVKLGEHEEAGAHTTPEADDLARAALGLVARGATHLAMEVSSHALALSRVAGVPFRVACFTNLTHDHLDFHGSLAAYGEAKARLFVDPAPGASVIHVGDAFGRGLASRAGGEVLTVAATADPGAGLDAPSVESDLGGTRAVVRRGARSAELGSPLIGRHNLENVMVALGAALALGAPLDDAARALGRATAAPGRLEQVSTADDDVLVLVDYAHTPDALTRALTTLRHVATRRVWCVFGCGGDRDREKRPRMGAAAAALADELVVTDDNPRGEPPDEITGAVMVGVRGAGRAAVVIHDRRDAIAHAVGRAAPGDVVLVAGKGHEPYQETAGERRAFDDRAEARAALVARREARR